VKSFCDKIKLFLKANYPIIYINTYEEERIIEELASVAKELDIRFYNWSETDGLTRDGEPVKGFPESRKPVLALNFVEELQEDAIFLFKDLHTHFRSGDLGIGGGKAVERKLRDLAISLRGKKKMAVITAPLMVIPSDITKEVTVMEYDLPGYEELEKVLDKVVERFKTEVLLSKEEKQMLIKAAQGLTLKEAERTFSRACVDDAKLNFSDIQTILDEKRGIIRKTGILEYYPATEKLANVGGMDNLKDWIIKRGKLFTDEAKEYGLPEPKGIMMVGISGCGKSLLAKAIAGLWKLPLLRFDIGKVFQKYVGESEENIRNAIKTAEAIAPSILWIDEIEKGFSGVSGDSGNDGGGVAARIFGTFLTWMQENKSSVFVVATANEIKNLPPELLRKGRFDEIFFIDLPKIEERKDIFKIHLDMRKKEISKEDLENIAAKSEGYTGAEIEQIVINAMVEAFYEKRQPELNDFLASVKKTVPLSVTMKEHIDKLRTWAKDRTLPAS
jgi:ATP-dependent 26S proteasome regulatory subunit